MSGVARQATIRPCTSGPLFFELYNLTSSFVGKGTAIIICCDFYCKPDSKQEP
jgi:hypothetical protein